MKLHQILLMVSLAIPHTIRAAQTPKKPLTALEKKKQALIAKQEAAQARRWAILAKKQKAVVELRRKKNKPKKLAKKQTPEAAPAQTGFVAEEDVKVESTAQQPKQLLTIFLDDSEKKPNATNFNITTKSVTAIINQAGT